MPGPCFRCGRSNLPHARYCAMCGRSLFDQPKQGGVRGAWVAMTIAALIVAAPFCRATRSHFYNAANLSCAEGYQLGVDRDFSLSYQKRDAVYRLICPSDDRVEVAHTRNGLNIRGTHREVEAVAGFIELLERLGGLSVAEANAWLHRVRPQWTTHQSYRLPRTKAEALFHALAFDDVPLFVWLQGNVVHVEASPIDQHTVEQMVRILRGQRPR